MKDRVYVARYQKGGGIVIKIGEWVYRRAKKKLESMTHETRKKKKQCKWI